MTVVVPAYREASVIGAKIDNLRAEDYGGPLQIVVVAEDAETAAVAAEHGAEVIRPTRRLGKAGALNAGFEAARAPIVVFTDANAMLTPGSLSRLASWFDDPAVGAVAGEKRVVGGEHGQGLYWEYESWLKSRESRLGTTIGLVGELGAVRRTLFRPLPEDVVVDDLWMALDVIESGLEIRYDPEAVAEEEGAGELSGEWERRTRVICGAIDLMGRRRNLLLRGPNQVPAQLWGHRLGRFALGPVAHAILVARAVAIHPGSAWGKLMIGVHTLFGFSITRWITGAHLSRGERALTLAMFLQLTGVGGVWRYVTGDRPALWPKQERDAPSAPPDPLAGAIEPDLARAPVSEHDVPSAPRRRFTRIREPDHQSSD